MWCVFELSYSDSNNTNNVCQSFLRAYSIQKLLSMSISRQQYLVNDT